MAGTTQPETAVAAGGDNLAAAHRALRADPSLQFHFAEYAPAPPPPPWMEALQRFLTSIAPILNVVFWAGAALIVALILFFLVREAARRWPMFSKKQKEAKPAPTPAFQPNAARARALLEEADRLAREGRYSEAARVLLHRSIEDIEQAFLITIGPAATSREIARLDPLSPKGRDVFSRIALAVETSLFGEQPLDATRYAECRAAYADFALGAGA